MPALEWLILLCVGAIAFNTGLCLGSLNGGPHK